MRTGRNKGKPVGGLTAATHLMMLSHLFDVRNARDGSGQSLTVSLDQALETVTKCIRFVVQRELASRTEQRSVLVTHKGPTGPLITSGSARCQLYCSAAPIDSWLSPDEGASTARQRRVHTCAYR